jgi:D-lactate dehydrogenase
MKVIFYSTMDYERSYFLSANKEAHELTFVEETLNIETANLAKNHDAVVIFAGDDGSTAVIEQLYDAGVRHIAIRAVGYDNVDLSKAHDLGIRVANVPEYSPYAIAEYAVSLILSLNRKTILAHTQVHAHNFSVGSLIGFDMHLKTVGIVGTGRTGSIVAKILHGFGCQLVGCDIKENEELVKKYNLKYIPIKDLCRVADIITLHVPLNAATKHLVDKELFDLMKPGVMLINTARGAVINTDHAIDALNKGTIGYLGIDVYEKEKGIFFFDLSKQKMNDDVLINLMSRPNVMVTPHQAFATQEALSNISEVTFYNIDCWSMGKSSHNEIDGLQ